VKGNWLITFDTSWIFAFVTILIFLVCSSIFDQLIYPRLVGRSVGLHPVVSMFVIFSGGALFGLMGMIIAFPLAGAIKVILERLIRITSAESVYDLRLPAVPLRHRTASEL
jgi:predicted PurR-regulated permease PerM